MELVHDFVSSILPMLLHQLLVALLDLHFDRANRLHDELSRLFPLVLVTFRHVVGKELSVFLLNVVRSVVAQHLVERLQLHQSLNQIVSLVTSRSLLLKFELLLLRECHLLDELLLLVFHQLV